MAFLDRGALGSTTGPGWVRAVVAAGLLIGGQPVVARDDSVVTVATAGHGGVYLPAGQAICQFVNSARERHGIRCLARASAGSVENIEALRRGERAYAIVQSDIQDAALEGRRQFAGAEPLPALRAVFSLHAEPLTVVVQAGSGIQSLTDLEGRRVNLGVEGSGMRATAEDVLAAFGFGGADRALLSDLPAGAQIQALCQGRIEAATFVVGHPSGYIQDATRACEARLIPVEGPAVEELLAGARYYAPATIAGLTYRGQPKDVPTLGVRATLVTLADRPEAEVYELVKAVFSNLELFRRLHPALADLDRAEMVGFGNTAPLHPARSAIFARSGCSDEVRRRPLDATLVAGLGSGRQRTGGRMLVTRRTLNRALAAGALVGLLPAMPGPGAAQAGKVPTDRVFDVLLKGESIGRHAITFTPEGDGFSAVTDLNLKVKLAFLTLLDMSHQSRELWLGGELKSMTSVTDDDGEVFKVDADADGEGIRVQSESGSIVAPPMSRTSNSIWDITMMRQSEIIDAQNGGVIGLVAEAQGDDTIQVLGRQVTAARYRGVTPAAAAQLWYAEDRLVQVRLEVRGETVDYRLVA